MARRHQLARWAAAACLATAAAVAFPAAAEASQPRVKVQLPTLPVQVPVILPSEVGLTPPAPLPELWLGLPPTAPAPAGVAAPAPLPPAPPPALSPTPAPPAAAVVPGAPAAAGTTVPVTVRTVASGDPGGGGRRSGFIDVLQTFALPLALIAALVAFLAVQAFVDRRDPKLAAAPMDDEVFSFR